MFTILAGTRARRLLGSALLYTKYYWMSIALASVPSGVLHGEGGAVAVCVDAGPVGREVADARQVAVARVLQWGRWGVLRAYV